MEALRNASGFLGTNASLLVDINLTIQIIFYIVLCLGVFLQRKQMYHWHDRTQTAVVVLNLFFIIFIMLPSFSGISRNIPAQLSETFVLVPFVHVILGTLSEGLAIYCLLAGFKILPRKIGVLRYWMWATFVFWTAAILFGIGTYVIWHTGVLGEADSGAVIEHNEDLVSEHSEDIADLETPPPPAEEATTPPEDEATSEAEPTATPKPAPEEEATATTPPDEIVGEHDEAISVPGPTEVPAEPEPTPVPLPNLGWNEVSPASADSPGPRYEHAMQYNPATNKVYLFGGRDGSTVFNDVWAYDVALQSWEQLAADSPAPPARYSTVMIVTDEGDRLYIATGQEASGAVLNDVWRLDIADQSWTDLSASAGDGPTARYGNPGGNIANNLTLTHGFGTTRYDDTWQFNTTSESWENITPAGDVPLKRCLFAATTNQSDLILHGGCASGFGDCFLEDTWVLDTDSQAWREILSAQKPAGRQHQTITAISNAPQAVLFGGEDADNNARDDVWLLDTSVDAWAEVSDLNAPPPARYNHQAVWIPEQGLLVYGGRNSSGPLADMWLLNLSDVQREVAPSPVEPTPVPIPTATPDLIDEHSEDGVSEHDGG